MSNVHVPPTCGIAIVGAGAAGLAAAIAAAERAKPADDVRILLLDGAHTLGAKILVSGGGRCNVTHHEVTPTDFFGNRRIIKNVLAAFSVEQTTAWFASLGVDLKRAETGKLFPVANKSRTVLNALIERCHQADTRRHLSGLGCGFGAVVNLFLIFAFHLVYRANLSDPVAFDRTAMTVGLVAFVIASIGSTIVLLLRYGRTE